MGYDKYVSLGTRYRELLFYPLKNSVVSDSSHKVPPLGITLPESVRSLGFLCSGHSSVVSEKSIVFLCVMITTHL